MNTSTINSEGYSPRQAAKILGREKQTIYKYLREGKLRAVDARREGKARARYRISAEELERFQNDNRRTVVLYDRREPPADGSASP